MMVTETGEEDQGAMRESLGADLVKDLFTFREDTVCGTHDMLECKRCSCVQVNHVPQADEVVEDDLLTWSHHCGTDAVPDGILADAARRMLYAHWQGKCVEGEALRDAPMVSFTMGCHIVYTEEQIARLEEEERALQQRREAKAVEQIARPEEDERAEQLRREENVAKPSAASSAGLDE